MAYRQGALIIWNPPGWPDDRCTMYDVHEQLIKEGKIHGVEVFNSAEYYPKAIDWCRDLKLAFLANSDIHSTTGDSYHPKPLGRPVTLVLAKERSEARVSAKRCSPDGRSPCSTTCWPAPRRC